MAKRKEGFLQGIIYLMTSQIIIKLLGMCYNLYLTNKRGFGDEGNGILMAGFQIYALVLGLCSIGVPNAVSKLVSESLEIGDINTCNRILKISLTIFTSIGFLFCIILYIFSDFLANKILCIPSCSLIIKILSPSIVFSSIESVYRGYFNGVKKISISAKSAGLEQFFKTILTILFVQKVANFTNYNTDLMAEAAALSSSLATIASFIYSYIKYKTLRFENINFRKSSKKISQILKEIFGLVIPISLTTAITIFGNNIDSVTIVRILKDKIGIKEAKEIYGIITSKVNLIVGLPLSLNGAVSISLIPEISRNIIKKDFKKLKKNIKFSLLVSLIIAVPVTLILLFYSKKIINILYPNASKGAELLRLSSITIIFCVFTQNLSGILQGVGDSKTHLYSVIVGIIVKIVLNFVLISNDNLLEKGAIISTIISDIVIFIIMFVKAKKKLGQNLVIAKKIEKTKKKFMNFKKS